MMDGHKWEMFKIDFKITIPVLLSFVVLVAAGVMIGLNQTGLVFVCLLGIVIFLFHFFAICPMMAFAHARFYEDLCVEAE